MPQRMGSSTTTWLSWTAESCVLVTWCQSSPKMTMCGWHWLPCCTRKATTRCTMPCGSTTALALFSLRPLTETRSSCQPNVAMRTSTASSPSAMPSMACVKSRRMTRTILPRTVATRPSTSSRATTRRQATSKTPTRRSWRYSPTRPTQPLSAPAALLKKSRRPRLRPWCLESQSKHRVAYTTLTSAVRMGWYMRWVTLHWFCPAHTSSSARRRSRQRSRKRTEMTPFSTPRGIAVPPATRSRAATRTAPQHTGWLVSWLCRQRRARSPRSPSRSVPSTVPRIPTCPQRRLESPTSTFFTCLRMSLRSPLLMSRASAKSSTRRRACL
eukprot:comp24007_c0_seq1/m.42806 comp24007_c0_seq1/g.42806  ORF comp24007_c0_seq1/g.42806 comp24007_c0_seq1/m.42806 type:complete len:327 (-) comp24007_c0_seq1:1321-2301(-)